MSIAFLLTTLVVVATPGTGAVYSIAAGLSRGSRDGVGGARASTGSGLSGLHDRIEALDGTLALESSPGSGTRIRAEIPLAQGPGAINVTRPIPLGASQIGRNFLGACGAWQSGLWQSGLVVGGGM